MKLLLTVIGLILGVLLALWVATKYIEANTLKPADDGSECGWITDGSDIRCR